MTNTGQATFSVGSSVLLDTVKPAIVREVLPDCVRVDASTLAFGPLVDVVPGRLRAIPEDAIQDGSLWKWSDHTFRVRRIHRADSGNLLDLELKSIDVGSTTVLESSARLLKFASRRS